MSFFTSKTSKEVEDHLPHGYPESPTFSFDAIREETGYEELATGCSDGQKRLTSDSRHSGSLTSGYGTRLDSREYSGCTSTDSPFFASGSDGLIKERIRKNFRFLKNELDVERITDLLIEDEFFSIDDKDRIESKKIRAEKVVCMLLKLFRLPDEAIKKFPIYLEKAGYSYVVDRIMGSTDFTEEVNTMEISSTEASNRLNQNRQGLTGNLEPLPVADALFEYGEMEFEEYEQVTELLFRTSQVELILKLLLINTSRLPRRFAILLSVLKHYHSDMYDRLLRGQAVESDYEEDLCGKEPNRVTAPRYKAVIQLQRVTKEASLYSLQVLNGCDSARIEITFRSSDPDTLHAQVIEKLREIVMLEVNGQLIEESEIIITEIKEGSIIIVLKACCQSSLKKLFQKSVQSALINTLNPIFSHQEIQSLMPSRVVVEVSLFGDPAERGQAKPKNISEMMKDHFDFLIEEIDALVFVDELMAAEVLTLEEKNSILNQKPVARRTRSRAMLELIMKKGAEKVFIKLLEKHKKDFILKRVFRPVENLNHPTDRLASKYRTLVDILCPQAMKNDPIVQTALQKATGMESRDTMAEMIIQHVLKSDDEIQHMFYHTWLSRKQPILQIFAEKDTKNARPPKKTERGVLVYKGIFTIVRSIGKFHAEKLNTTFYERTRTKRRPSISLTVSSETSSKKSSDSSISSWRNSRQIVRRYGRLEE